MRRLLLLLLAVAGRCAGLALSHWDLEGANGTCDGRASCAEASAGASAGAAPWRERNCQCDAACARFGDCCLDSEFFAAAEQRRAAASFACVALRRFGGVYMVTQCPPAWPDAAARRRCELQEEEPGRGAGSGGAGAPPDPLAAMPVTSAATNVTYRSAACAACHGDLGAGARLWRPRVECPGLRWPAGQPPAAAARALRWDPRRRQWGLLLPANCSRPTGEPPSTPPHYALIAMR
ncbi:hypothetical protein R5R35_006524 [Gryllus longicercus]|uniref:SMB domain-containing protein n=1 Tax=Gryllus longicercus TaxID=2509291 RepID=A0AAN9Z1U8_9ORTH